MKKVQVLMSTYNGEKYLKEQIDSILAQTGIEVHLLARDDGSTDRTLEILKSYPDIEVLEGRNVGVTKSFLELIRLAGEYDYYSFADQDDVWDTDKLEVAVDKLAEYECPAIYSGNTRLVDGELNYIKNETLKPITTLGSAIAKNYVTGCTTVFNAELIKFLKMYESRNSVCHDWWANLVCLAVGGISIYDYEPHMSYRQHGNNVVSGNSGFLKKWTSRLKKFNNPYRRDLMAKEIVEQYKGEISLQNTEILKKVINKECVQEMSTGNRVDDFLFRVCVILGRI